MKKTVFVCAKLAAFASAHAEDRTSLEQYWDKSQAISSACKSCISEHGKDLAEEFAICYQNTSSGTALEKCGGDAFYGIIAGVCSDKCSN